MFARWRKKLAAVVRDVLAAWLALRDPRTPLVAKLVCVLSAVYVVMPVDIIPDVIPIIGWLDDMAILPLAALLAGRLIPTDALADLRMRAERIMLRHGRSVLLAVAGLFILWLVLAALGLWYWLN